MCSKSISTETVFTKTEKNNEWNINFIQIHLLGIQNTYSNELFPLVKAPSKLHFWYSVKLHQNVSFSVQHILKILHSRLLYSYEQLYIHICMQKHIQHNKDEWTQFLRKIHLSLYWKDCAWEVSWRPNKDCNILTPPHSSGYHSLSFPFSWAAQLGAWGPSLCRDMVLIPASSLQLIWTSYHRGYIRIWHPPTSCERHNSHSIQPLDSQGRPWSPDIFHWMHLLFTQVHFFFWQLGRVGGQYATRWIFSLGN